MLNHTQMAVNRHCMFPFPFNIPVVENADTLVKQILRVIAKKLEEPLKVTKAKKHNIPVIPSPKAVEVPLSKQFTKKFFEAYFGVSEGGSKDGPSSVPNDTLSEGEKAQLNGVLPSLDNQSRTYSHNTASRFESARVQTAAYQQARQVSLDNLFQGKVRIAFNADNLQLTRTALIAEKVFLVRGGMYTHVDHYYYYVSWYKKYYMAGEGVELIYFLSTLNVPTLISASSAERLKDPIFKDHHANKTACK